MEFRHRILVVDDEPPIRDLIATILREEGYSVELAADGPHALTLLASNTFDLIVSDLMMPDMSGLDILVEVKTRWPATEVIFVTAFGSMDSAVEALRHGAYDYLTKPFSSQELVLSVQRTLAYRCLKIEKEELLTNLQRQVSTRNALVQASQRIATLLDQPEVIRTVLEAAFNVLPQVEWAALCYKSAETDLVVQGLDKQRAEVNHLPLDKSLIFQVLDQKQPLYYPDWIPPDLETPPSVEASAKSLIIEPLSQADSSLRALVVISQKQDAFDEDYRQLLTMLAAQAAIALQNAQLYAEARRVDELEALHEAGQVINRTLDLQETLSATLTITRHLTGAAVGQIYLYAPEHHRLASVITSGEEAVLTDADRRHAAEIALALLANYQPDQPIPEQKVTLVQAQASDPALPAFNQAETYSIQSWLAVPLSRSHKFPTGVLELGSGKINAFTADDVRLIQVIAAQAATAIENTRLYEEVRWRLQQTEALGALSQSIVNTLDLSRVLDLVVHSVIKTIPVTTHSWLYLLNEDDSHFTLEASAAKQNIPLPARLELYRQQVIKQAARQHVPLRGIWFDEEQAAWSLLVAPLKVNERVIGAISIESPSLDAFVSSDETLLNTFANHASIAIQNANLFRELSFAYRDLAQHQAETVRSHKTLQALFEGITDGLYIVDQAMDIVAINQAEAKRLGVSPESLIGQPCDASLWGEAAPAMAALVMNTFATGHEGNWESQTDAAHRGAFVDRDVRTYPIFLPTASTPSLQLEKRRVGQVIILAQDVSEKRQWQASLFRSANLAIVGRLAASVAHQISNPLTVIMANGQLLEMELEPDSPDYPIMQDIIESSLQIRQIVQNLLDFSTQESYDWFETDISKTIEEGLALIAHSLEKSEIEVILQVDHLSPTIASASHLKLLWMNLLLNARDAIIEKGQPGTIIICAQQAAADQITIQFIDNGSGIAPEHHSRLFQPFFSTKPPGQGLGLGLYTCRTIVEQHHGQIEIDSQPDKPGTTVTVTLPVQTGSPEE